MPFVKGDPRSNRNGRPKGSLNKLPIDLKGKITDYLNENIEATLVEISNLKSELKIKYFFELLQYVLSKAKENIMPDSVLPDTMSPEMFEFQKRLNDNIEKMLSEKK
jgi:hypothetical protein